jgi:uncharacterized membrane protein YdjX (TVP38/TMEM64 family)
MELDIEKIKIETQKHLSRNKLILSVILVLGVLGFLLIYQLAPTLTATEQKLLYRVPATPQVLYHQSILVQKYAQNNYWYVIFSISYLYILLQSFSIPGPPLLNILSGAMFGFTQSFILVTLCSTLGSILCYIIFETIGKGIAIRLFPNKILLMHQKVQSNKSNLFFYLLSLRVAPFIPKWLTAISSPIIGVPLKTFALSACFGLMPHNFIHINTGIAINSMNEFGLTMENILCLAGLGVLSLVPTFVGKRVKNE